MTILGNFIYAVVTVFNMALSLYMYVIIARAVLSWVSPDPYNPIVRFIHNATEPVLRKVRSKVPSIDGIDISPLVVIFAILIIQIFVKKSLVTLMH